MAYNYYIPNKHIKLGNKIWVEMFEDAVCSKELMWRLFVRDFLAKYKQTLLGVLWAVIMPVVMVGTFVFLNRSGVLNIGRTDVPYPLFALLGLTIWQLFATGLTSCTNSILQGGGMVVKINFPKESLVVAALANSVFDFLIRLVLLVLVFAFYKVLPSPMAILLPVVIIPLLLLTLGLGFLLSLLNVLARDISYFVTLFTTFLLFLTPVLYPEPKAGFFKILSFVNPLSALVNEIRNLIFFGYMKDPVLYFIASVFSIFLFLICWRIFHIVETRMAERV